MQAESRATIVVVRGEAFAWARSTNSCWVEIRGADGAVNRCRFDSETGFERERMSVPVTAIAPGNFRFSGLVTAQAGPRHAVNQRGNHPRSAAAGHRVSQ